MTDSDSDSGRTRSANVSAEDALKYAAAGLTSTSNWVLDSIGGGSCCDGDHEDELNALGDRVSEIALLAAEFGDPNRYSDGRAVQTSTWIVEGELSTGHVWHPNPPAEKPQTWRGNLSSGYPDVPSPGVYEVEIDPSTQEIRVRVVRIVGEDAGA